MRIVLIVLMVLMCSSAFAADLKIFTEEYPPYNYTKDGTLTGKNTELMVKALKKAGMGIAREDIRVTPWARAYNNVQKKANNCVYSTTLTDERKPMFIWVGPLSKTAVGIVGLGGSPIKSLDEIRNAKIGVVRNDVGHQLLKAQGFSDDNLDIAPSAPVNIKKLYAGRVKYFAYELNTLQMTAQGIEGIDPASLKTLYILKESELYLACNKQSDTAALDRLQKALDEIAGQ